MLSIRLSDENIILRGAPEDCSGTIVSGTVVFHPSKATKVKQIILKLHGTISIDTNQEIYGEKKTIVRRKLVLFDSTIPSYSLYQFDTQEHRFDFNLPLRGDLPESMNLPHGRIVYTLTAVVSRPFPHTNLKYNHELKIQRLCYYEALTRLKNSAKGTWYNSVRYYLSVRKSVYLAGEELRMAMQFQIANGASVDKVCLSLAETIVYKHPVTRSPLTEMTQLSSSILMNLGPSQEMKLPIPPDTKIHCVTGFISVKHCVHVRVKFRDQNGKHGNVELELPIIIQSSEQRAITNALPSYDDVIAIGSESPPAYRPRRELQCH